MSDKMREAIWDAHDKARNKAWNEEPGTFDTLDAFREGIAWQAAQSVSVPVVGDVVAWVRLHPDGALSSEFIADDIIEPIRRNSGAWLPMIIQPATSITAAELDALRKDAAKVLHAEQIRIAAVAAIREVTGCPDIKGKDGSYLVYSLIVNLIEMQDDAAIAGETNHG